MIISLIRATDKIEGMKKYLPYISLPLSYSLMRILFYYFPNPYQLGISTLSMVIITFIVTMLILNKGDKFKTLIKIKLRKKKSEEKKDG